MLIIWTSCRNFTVTIYLQGLNAELHYYLDDPSGAFDIVQSSGMIYVRDSFLLDREVTEQFEFQVSFIVHCHTSFKISPSVGFFHIPIILVSSKYGEKCHRNIIMFNTLWLERNGCHLAATFSNALLQTKIAEFWCKFYSSLILVT